MEEFEKYVLSNPIRVESFHPYFEKALNEMVIAGGKRFRPDLMFAVINAFDEGKIEKSFPVALAIEIMHTYSLIHDDLPVMDNADLRRGHKTLHKTYNDVIAVLVGDGLNTHAFSLIAECNLNDSIKIALVRELAFNAGVNGMVIGQVIDSDLEDRKLTLDEIAFLHKKKTGMCIAGPLKMGAIICELDENFQNKLYEFGLKIGLLFQVQDDIFDVTKSEEEAAKSVGVDENKNTYVNLLGLTGAIEKADDLVDEIEILLEDFDENLKASLKELLDKYIYRHRV